MSIINEALKKAQVKFEKNRGPGEKTAASRSEQPGGPLSGNTSPAKDGPAPSAGSCPGAPAGPSGSNPDLSGKKPVFPAVLLVLLLVLAFALLRLFPKTSDETEEAPAPEPLSVQELAAPAAAPEISPAPAEAEDPAALPPETSAERKKTALNISGIVSTGDKNVALINNEIYEEGDHIDGVEITEITIDQVTLQYEDGTTQTLSVK